MDMLFMLLQENAGGFAGLFQGNNKMTQTVMIGVFLVGFLVLYYFLFIRPQAKKRKEAEKMLNSIGKGDKVITVSGMHGKVVSVKDNEVKLRVDANTEITFDKSAISKVLSSNQQNSVKEKDKTKKENTDSSTSDEE